MIGKLLVLLALVSGMYNPVFAQRPHAIATPRVASDPKVQFTIAPQIWQNFGLTEYDMDISILTDSGLYVLKSKLEFPLDVVMAGVSVDFHSTSDKLYAWSIGGGFFVNLDDPSGVMKDHDWGTLRWGRVDKFSYTESTARMKSALATVEGYLRVLQKKRFSLDLWGGYRYHRVEQDLIGFTGWQLDSNFVRYLVSGTEQGIYYKVTYKTPFVGLRSNIVFRKYRGIRVSAAYAQVWASDYDDHLLRNKVATSHIMGRGVITGLNAFYTISGGGRVKPFIELVGSFLYFYASGSQEQRWYGDDPITAEDDTGNLLQGIPHEINSQQASVGLRVGVAF